MSDILKWESVKIMLNGCEIETTAVRYKAEAQMIEVEMSFTPPRWQIEVPVQITKEQQQAILSAMPQADLVDIVPCEYLRNHSKRCECSICSFDESNKLIEKFETFAIPNSCCDNCGEKVYNDGLCKDCFMSENNIK